MDLHHRLLPITDPAQVLIPVSTLRIEYIVIVVNDGKGRQQDRGITNICLNRSVGVLYRCRMKGYSIEIEIVDTDICAHSHSGNEYSRRDQ